VAPRAYWKGYLKLSLVSCPIALYPATSEREKISFNQLNKETGNRIRYKKIDAGTGEDVEQANIIKGYEVAKDHYIELSPEELEAVAIESNAPSTSSSSSRGTRLTNFISGTPITSPRTAKSGNRPLPLSARRSARKVWSPSARSFSPPASISSR
jgi:hypothetical protein